jgi:hypothetical protein
MGSAWLGVVLAAGGYRTIPTGDEITGILGMRRTFVFHPAPFWRTGRPSPAVAESCA